MSFLIHWLSGALAWAFGLLDALPKHIYVLVCEGVVKIVDAIPVPAYFSAAATYVAQLPPLVTYISGGLEIPYGIGVILSAYTLRFIIRRIPFIN
jgi:hypothetical protein